MLLMPLLSRACMIGLPQPPTTAATTVRECKDERNECLQRCSPHAPLAEQVECEQRCQDRYLDCLYEGSHALDGDGDWGCYVVDWTDDDYVDGELGCNADHSDDDGWTSGDDGNDSGDDGWTSGDDGWTSGDDGWTSGDDGGDDDGDSDDGDDGDWGQDWGE